MQKENFLLCIICLLLFTGCFTTKNFDPSKKFSKEQLQQDYTLLRNILEKKHPALYWYTSKDSMNYYFDSIYHVISDSMTELQFGWKVLAPLTNKIHCGHTSFSMSKGWNKSMRGKRVPSFPLFLKIWGDTMVVTGNLNRKDSLFKRGTIITSVNGISNKELISHMMQYFPLDGYSDNVNYVRLSSNFPLYHRYIFGIYNNYSIGYIDSKGNQKIAFIPMYNPVADTAWRRQRMIQPEKPSRKKIKKESVESARSLIIDTTISTATIVLNTFSNGESLHLRSFIKQSFKKISQQNVKHLIIDLRSNGGGDVPIYVQLLKYIRHTEFKVADTAYAVAKNLSPFSTYIKERLLNNLTLLLLTRKHSDGNYHFGYWERHLYHPKSNNHFNGQVYVLTNGPTFSASTLFCTAVKGQQNVKLIGEETGGGWHGNSGIMIPDITLPITQLRVRLPLFKIVQYNHVPKNGRGVMPDIYIPPTVEGVRKNIDRKMQVVKEMIRNSNKADTIKLSTAN